MASIIDFPASFNASPAESLRLVEQFLRIADPTARQRMVAIVEAVADESDRAGAPPRAAPAAPGVDILAICRRVLER